MQDDDRSAVDTGERTMEFTPVSPVPGVLSEEQALEAARWHLMRSHWPNARAEAQLGELTDHDWYEESPSGERTYMCKGRLVWLVTFSGIEMYSASGGKPSIFRERHVVVDAVSGERLMEFSVR